MNTRHSDLSSLLTENEMLYNILNKANLNINQFADYLEIERSCIWRWRKGKFKFSLTMRQIHKLEKLLNQQGLHLVDLPEDWILDKPRWESEKN